jgi:HPt (histidine-containing phosphotransfer) domain-containing protein
MTAYAMKEDKERCLSVGMDDFIAKPVSPEIILETLKKWLPDVAFKNFDEQEPEVSDVKHVDRYVFDPDMLNARLLNNKALITSLKKDFLEYMPAKINELMQNIHSADIDMIRQVAHSLKGTAANMSASEIHDLSIEVEEAAKGGDLILTAAKVAKLEAAFMKVKEIFENS